MKCPVCNNKMNSVGSIDKDMKLLYCKVCGKREIKGVDEK